MARPRKKKLEVAETMAEDDGEAEDDTGVTGAQQPAVDGSTQAAANVDPASGPGGKRWRAAFDDWKETSLRAVKLRVVADKYVEQEKLAQRIHDAKMRRLDNGDKLKRRKSPMRAACRTYEAIIDLNMAQLKCAWMRCKAAEAERDEATAELRLNELE